MAVFLRNLRNWWRRGEGVALPSGSGRSTGIMRSAHRRRTLLNFRRNPANLFLVCFFAGIIAGTVAANIFYPSLADEAAWYLGLLEHSQTAGREAQLRIFYQIMRQRLTEVLIAWLFGMTVYGLPCFCLLTGGFGLSVGVVLSVMTGQKGLNGLFLFAASVMPQALFYVPVWCLLILWGVRQGERLRIFALLLIFLFLVAGVASEVWLNPFFLRLAGG